MALVAIYLYVSIYSNVEYGYGGKYVLIRAHDYGYMSVHEFSALVWEDIFWKLVKLSSGYAVLMTMLLVWWFATKTEN